MSDKHTTILQPVLTCTAKATGLPPLSPENQKDYWCERWTQNDVPWRESERAVGDQGFMNNLSTLLKLDQGFFLSQEEEAKEVEKMKAIHQKTKNCNVFVPLCGDSGLLFFLFRHGFDCTGLDLSADGLDNIVKECGGDKTLDIKITENAEKTVKTYEIKRKTSSFEGQNTNTMILIAGDLFKFQSPRKFDIVYDRASAVAVPPPTRDQYFDVMKKIVLKTEKQEEQQRPEILSKLEPNVSSAIFFGCIIRREGCVSGPPFRFTAEQVCEQYKSEEGFEYEVIRMPTAEEVVSSGRPFDEGNLSIYLKK